MTTTDLHAETTLAAGTPVPADPKGNDWARIGHYDRNCPFLGHRIGMVATRFENLSRPGKTPIKGDFVRCTSANGYSAARTPLASLWNVRSTHTETFHTFGRDETGRTIYTSTTKKVNLDLAPADETYRSAKYRAA